MVAKPKILFVPVLGQSNAVGLGTKSKDGDTGLIHLTTGLKNKTDFSKIDETMLAVGASSVDGNAHKERAWWFPNEDKPGDLLTKAVSAMKSELSALRKQGTVMPVVIWGQGESDAYRIGNMKTESARTAAMNRYMEATRDVFDYIHDRVDSSIKFYLMETGRYNVTGAKADGVSQSYIDIVTRGLTYIRAAQEQLGKKYKDVDVAADYRDLPMQADSVSRTDSDYKPSWKTDVWHLTPHTYEKIGDRLADYISRDIGKGSSIPAPPSPDPGTNDNTPDVLQGTDGKVDIFRFGHTTYEEMKRVDQRQALDIRDIIDDFETGAGGDVIDVSQFLDDARYQGKSAISTGFIKIQQQGADTNILLDPDGTAGSHASFVITVLTETNARVFEPMYNLVI